MLITSHPTCVTIGFLRQFRAPSPQVVTEHVAVGISSPVVGLIVRLLGVGGVFARPEKVQNEDWAWPACHPSGLGDTEDHFIFWNFQPAIWTVAFVHAFCM